ncbi:DUF4296 domain-containing protein [Winogradskyella maritima]|uniref:DUF4296 domain-containing protein n=1 Tax=Winogradskyella maritima TaxID=1517766 RepID=A0ABV8AFY8_9FLAO|nr:DUF4296 domain-containing protein [Winogradskyella maritima]
MKTRLVFFTLLFLGLTMSCEKSVKPPKPDNLISKDKMHNVLYDMFIINSAKGINRKLLENEVVNPEKYILEKHSIDSTQFAQSNAYYAHDIEAYQEIIAAVRQRLVKEKEAAEKAETDIKEAAKRKRDSLKKVNANKETKPIIATDKKRQ